MKLTTIENRIVDSPYFSRLASVSQMHSAHLVYPNATYTRKVHSLGAMHIAHRAICQILAQQHWPFTAPPPHPLIVAEYPPKRDWKLKPLNLMQELARHGIRVEDEKLAGIYVVQAMRLAALLHDIGHAPLSHLYESSSKNPQDETQRYDHEAKSAQIIRECLTKPPEGETEPFLEPADADFVAAILDKSLTSSKLAFLHDIISGALDVDKLDYLLRDSHATGTTEYGTVDLDRIIDALVVHDGRLCYASNGLDAVIQALNAMFFMYNNVYLHDTVRGFDLAALEGLQPLHSYLRQYQELLPPTLPDGTPGTPFVEFDDASFVNMIDQMAHFERTKQRNGPFTKAHFALRRLRRREKTFRAVVDTRLAIPLSNAKAYRSILKDLTDDLERIRLEIASLARIEKDDLKLDLHKSIRPIGVALDEITHFLTSELIYDTTAAKPVEFANYQPHYKTLTRIVVPVRVYLRTPAKLPPATQQALIERVTTHVRKEQNRLTSTTL